MIQSNFVRPMRTFQQMLPSRLPTNLSSAVSQGNQALQAFGSQSSLNGLAALAKQNLGSLNLSAIPAGITRVTDPIARRILQKPPFAPTDVNMFSPQPYTGATPLQPAAPRNYTDPQLRSMLNSTFSTRFNGNRSQVNQAMNLYTNPQLTQTVPDPRLRAALVSLKGTAGETAINTVQSGVYQTVRFGEPLTAGANAEVVFPSATGKPEIIINQKYQYEDPRIIAPLLAHETLHQDRNVTNKEEMLSNALDSMVYGQVILENPTLARSGTELARRQNTRLMARVNSRDAQGNLRLTTAQGNVYPNSAANVPNFASVFGNLGGDTAGNAHLNAMLSKVTGQPVTGAGFNDATVNRLDQNQRLFSPSQVVALAGILKLQIPRP